jgi:stearoyl-CoA desaturase (delta-9 desaturase)
MYIRLLEILGLAAVRRVAPVPRFTAGKTECDADTVKAIITHRHYVLAQYTCSVKDACRQEIRRLQQTAATASGVRIDARSARALLRWLRLHTWDWKARGPITLDPAMRQVKLLHTAYAMRQELSELWSRSSASTDQLLRQLRDWRGRAEASGVAAIREFARRLPHLV